MTGDNTKAAGKMFKQALPEEQMNLEVAAKKDGREITVPRRIGLKVCACRADSKWCRSKIESAVYNKVYYDIKCYRCDASAPEMW